MSRTRTLAGAAALLGLAWIAAAHPLPPTEPAGTQVRPISLTLDRSALPASVPLLPADTVLGFDADPQRGHGKIHLTCRSASDAANGRCATADTAHAGPGVTDIVLRLVERRSGQSAEVTLSGALRRVFADAHCTHAAGAGIERPLTTGVGAPCAGLAPAGTTATLAVSAAGLSALVAGHWQGELILDLRTDAQAAPVAALVWPIALTLTDHDAAAIHFPALDTASPQVRLELRHDPLAGTLSGTTQLDMCLYDGLGALGGALGITASDVGGQVPGGAGFSLWHGDGGTDATRRLDYGVTLEFEGARLPMANGVEQSLRGIDTARLRPVLLPGMPQPVYCVPTPLRLTAVPVPMSSKRAGAYSGDLRIEMRLPAVRP